MIEIMKGHTDLMRETMRSDVEEMLRTHFEESHLNMRNQNPESSHIVENVNLQVGGYSSYLHSGKIDL